MKSRGVGFFRPDDRNTRSRIDCVPEIFFSSSSVNGSSMPFDAEAKRTEDEKFAGHFDGRGCFSPSSAGPNPAREYSGDNVGNLTVLAHARDGEHVLEGRAHLVVTVQRWNTPPIY